MSFFTFNLWDKLDALVHTSDLAVDSNDLSWWKSAAYPIDPPSLVQGGTWFTAIAAIAAERWYVDLGAPAGVQIIQVNVSPNAVAGATTDTFEIVASQDAVHWDRLGVTDFTAALRSNWDPGVTSLATTAPTSTSGGQQILQLAYTLPIARAYRYWGVTNRLSAQPFWIEPHVWQINSYELSASTDVQLAWLPIGTAGQKLEVVSGLPAWVT